MQAAKTKAASGAKKIAGMIKLQIESGKANPAPPIGPALGQKGLNIMDFCKKFNEATKDKEGPVTVIINYTTDKLFTFILKSPPVSYLIKKAIGLKSGSKEAGKINVGKIKTSQLKEIAIIKQNDMSAASLKAAIKSIAGSAISMGIEVEDDDNVLKN